MFVMFKPYALPGRGRLQGVAALVALAALAPPIALSLAGCGSSRASAAAARPSQVTERDFKIEAPAKLHSGLVSLRVQNEGPDQHELIVVRGNEARLPLRPDGLTVDEEALEAVEAGALEPGEPGHTRALDVDLKPGRYVFFCNMEGHFMAGMHTEVVVE
jgi:uncharacterized cupredoxin-like copper-binding protein